MDLELRNRKAIVTGGSRGIGKEIARTLGEEGAQVAICGRNEKSLADTLGEFDAEGLNITGKPVDVGSRSDYIAWLEWAVESMGGLDIFVHNVTSGVESGELIDWEYAHRVDMMGAVIGCETLQPVLENSPAASIIFISSVSALVIRTGNKDEHAYGAVKAGLIQYAGQLSRMLGRKGIRVNVVSPGAIDFPGSPWDLVRQSDPAYHAAVSKASAIGRMGTPQEVAWAVSMLASPRASLITGANLLVDGGSHPHVDF